MHRADNDFMHIRFTKMQGAGNDFVVLDETQGLLGLSAAQYRFLADRHFGVGADQILSVRASPGPGLDFEYLIHNADGGQVEQCGNGARCFVRYVHDKGLSTRNPVRVKVMNGELELRMHADGRVTVDMGAPVFALDRVPFNAEGLKPEGMGTFERWPLALPYAGDVPVAVLSMGNPHAVLLVDDVESAPVPSWGPWIESHERFPRRVNAGFLQVVGRQEVRLRVYERGAGETLACGTGACAVAFAARADLGLESPITVQLPGGALEVELDGDRAFMTGAAHQAWSGELDLATIVEGLPASRQPARA